MVLDHDGFEGASPEAMESFTGMVETCELHFMNPLLVRDVDTHQTLRA
jgi:hypothetical protein